MRSAFSMLFASIRCRLGRSSTSASHGPDSPPTRQHVTAHGRDRYRRPGRATLASSLAVAWLLHIVATSAGCRAADHVRVDSVEVQLLAHDTSWNASYLYVPGATGGEGISTGREIHVPVGAQVRLLLASRDFISDFALPELGLRDFAAPDLPSEFQFVAEREGRYDVRGDELCGRPHDDRSRGSLVVEDAASYRAWIRTRIDENTR